MLAQYLANWASNINYSQLPRAVVEVSKKAFLDVTAVGIAGFNAPVSQAARGLAQPFFCDQPGNASLFNGEQQSVKQAAYCNTVAAHALDMDDTCYAGIAHATVIIAPLALANAEANNKSGKDLLAAFIAGSEIAYALGTAVGPTLYENDFWPTGVLGAIGGAAALAKLKNVDEQVFARAIAFAALSSSPFRCMHGTDSKPLAAGETVKRAIDAVEIAQSQATIPLDVFERAEGPLQATTDGRFDREKAVQLGHKWRLLDPGLVIKLYPLCSCAQTSVEALLDIIDSNHLSEVDIDSVSVTTTSKVAKTLKYDSPEDENQAMFSLTYPLACVLVNGRVTPKQISQGSINRTDINAAMRKVSYNANDEFFDLHESPEAAVVQVKTIQGKELQQKCLYPTGDPRSPVTDEQFADKIKTCLGDVNIDKFINAFENIEQLEDIGELTSHFKGNSR